MNIADQSNIMDGDLKAIEPENFPVSFFVGNLGPFIGMVDQTEDAFTWMDAGQREQSDFRMLVRLSQYPVTMPVIEADAQIQIPDKKGEKKKYFINSITVHPDGISVVYSVKKSS